MKNHIKTFCSIFKSRKKMDDSLFSFSFSISWSLNVHPVMYDYGNPITPNSAVSKFLPAHPGGEMRKNRGHFPKATLFAVDILDSCTFLIISFTSWYPSPRIIFICVAIETALLHSSRVVPTLYQIHSCIFSSLINRSLSRSKSLSPDG